MKCYYLNNKRVQRPKSVIIGETTYVPPTEEQLLAAGYEIKEEPYVVKTISLSYGQRVDLLIRERYSLSEELAIQRQRDTKPEEFQEYFNYCEECKTRVKGNTNEGKNE